MTKYELTKRGKAMGLTYKEILRLVALKGEVDWDATYNDSRGVALNESMPGHQWASFSALEDKGYINIGRFVTLTDKCESVPSIGPVAFMGGFDDSDILDRI